MYVKVGLFQRRIHGSIHTSALILSITQEGVFTCCDENGRELARIGEGSCFGELALLRQDRRAATVIAMTPAKASKK
jgi:CRP-like cAMP-binding protein